MKKYLLIALLFSQVLSAQQVAWPEITKENKPWTRWWWPGSIVTPSDLTAAMENYQKSGLGGMEIAVIYGVKGEESRFINYLSTKWMEMFRHTLDEGKRLGLGIDLANASGWPFGGPWVDPSDACRNINFKTYTLKHGETLNEKIEFIQQPLVRPVGQKPDITKLIDPIAKNKDLQLYALDQIRFEKPLPLQVLMAYSDRAETINLTSKITKAGYLEWIAPEGNWTLYALFEGWHGKMAERAGPGGEGDVIDHFSGRAITRYLSHFDSIFRNHDNSYLRGYFNDSYEVDDASGQSNWTTNLLPEFKNRRGYDLTGYLPALFQKDAPEINSRVLSDYRETIAELILEKFTVSWTSWANKQGKITRNQSHGSPGNILDLYAASDIPETEGNEVTKFKFASSAANVTGKKYVSAEAATWLNEHFISSLSDVKKAVDLFFLGGINHIFYHGTCFTPQNEPWPGFLFYAAVEFTPANSFWNEFPALNGYIANVQSFMQQGRSDNDILFYFPVYDRYADYGRGMLEHFDEISPAFKGTPFKTGADLMMEKGYSYDYISDLQLKDTETVGKELQTSGNNYKVLVLPGSKYIPIETFTKIIKLANEGAKIIFYGNMPENVSGFADYTEKTDAFSRMKLALKFNDSGAKNIVRAIVGEGSVIMGDDLSSLLSFAGVKREVMTDSGLAFSRRKTDNGYYYFINNKSDKEFSGTIPLSFSSASVGLFNPMTRAFGTTKSQKNAGGNTEVFLKLKPGESIIVAAYNKKVSGKPYLFFDNRSEPVEITGKWKVDFIEGGPELPAAMEINRLVSWTEPEFSGVKDFSGTAKYSISFKKPAGKADAWKLDLGKVCESARITLNGKEIAVLIGPEYSVILNKKDLAETNILEIRVSNLMANRIAYMDRNKIEWKRFYNINMAARLKENNKNGIFDAADWKPRESGLIGPVTITMMTW